VQALVERLVVRSTRWYSSGHHDLYEWHKSLLQEFKDRMLMVAGVGHDGVFRIEIDKLLGIWDRSKRVTRGANCDVNFDGDGRVPFASAQLEHVTARYVVGKHGGLPNIPAVSHDVLAWLTDGNLRLPVTCAGALSQHLSADTSDSPAPRLDGTAVRDRLRVLPEYEDPTPEFREQVVKQLDAGQLAEINLVKIL
jgi:hypothetical protein